MNILLLNWLTVAIAISAFVYSNMLIAPGHILNQVFEFLEEKLPEYILKPLISCQYCVSGQWSLWFYFYLVFVQNEGNYFWWLHLWFILQTIFVAKIITYLYYQILDK